MKSEAKLEMRGRNLAVRRAVGQSLAALGGKQLESETDTQRLRAAPLRRVLEERAITLVRDPLGLLRWEIGGVATGSPGFRALATAQARRAALRRAPLAATLVLTQTFFDRIEPPKVGEWLKLADQKLTRPAWNQHGELWGLRRFTRAGKLLPFGVGSLPKLAGKKVLLIVHGTFSNSDVMLKDMASAPEGPAMLSAAVGNTTTCSPSTIQH